MVSDAPLNLNWLVYLWLFRYHLGELCHPVIQRTSVGLGDFKLFPLLSTRGLCSSVTAVTLRNWVGCFVSDQKWHLILPSFIPLSLSWLWTCERWVQGPVVCKLALHHWPRTKCISETPDTHTTKATSTLDLWQRLAAILQGWMLLLCIQKNAEMFFKFDFLLRLIIQIVHLCVCIMTSISIKLSAKLRVGSAGGQMDVTHSKIDRHGMHTRMSYFWELVLS
jgi:hypothetical protein